jgi:glucose-6-phosphate isomerase
MSLELWERYKKYLCVAEPVGVSLDISRMHFADDFFAKQAKPIAAALDAMAALESGAIANPDEKRMVGHYWLRAPELAPTPALTQAIEQALSQVRSFAADVHSGKLKPERAARFTNLLVVGIGGSALGPQLAADALGQADDKLRVHFLDNTDPDGFDRTFALLGQGLGETLTVVVSKSGGTKETRNAMLETQAAYKERGLSFAKHAVAVTGEGSELDKVAVAEGWIARFPMWDWVGGRTSQLSAVGLLPAALQGLDIDGLLSGARDMDAITRGRDVQKNPAALLALMWYHAGDGRGQKDMVVIPYKDRFLLLSKYLQQLVMESIGKEKDLDGKRVQQGIAVYGNKGSTDQHAYVQQLREGIHNFFATFIEVKQSRRGRGAFVEEGVTSGDYLLGFLLGTRQALYENGRESLTLTVDDTSARTLGALIALYERAVGLYASLVNINAYHQPGVEAGKVAAASVLAIQRKLLGLLTPGSTPRSASELASAIGAPEAVETVYKLLEHLAASPEHGVVRHPSADPFAARYGR